MSKVVVVFDSPEQLECVIRSLESVIRADEETKERLRGEQLDSFYAYATKIRENKLAVEHLKREQDLAEFIDSYAKDVLE